VLPRREDVLLDLTMQLARDGEGVTKLLIPIASRSSATCACIPRRPAPNRIWTGCARS
jgi:hypothetical protein